MRSWINNSLSTLPTARRDHGFSFGPFGTFLVFGGSTKQSRTAYLNDLWSYTPGWTFSSKSVYHFKEPYINLIAYTFIVQKIIHGCS